MWRRKDPQKKKDGESKNRVTITTTNGKPTDPKLEDAETSPRVVKNHSKPVVGKKSGKSALNLKPSNEIEPRNAVAKTGGKSALNLSTTETICSGPEFTMREMETSICVSQSKDPPNTKSLSFTDDVERNPQIGKTMEATEKDVSAVAVPAKNAKSIKSMESNKSPVRERVKKADSKWSKGNKSKDKRVSINDSPSYTVEDNKVYDENNKTGGGPEIAIEAKMEKPESAVETELATRDDKAGLKKSRDPIDKNGKHESMNDAGVKKSKTAVATKPKRGRIKNPDTDDEKPSETVKTVNTDVGSEIETACDSLTVKCGQRDEKESSIFRTVDAAVGSAILLEDINDKNGRCLSTNGNYCKDIAVDPIDSLETTKQFCKSEAVGSSRVEDNGGSCRKKDVETRNSDDLIKRPTCCQASGQGVDPKDDQIQNECCMQTVNEDEGIPEGDAFKNTGTSIDIRTSDQSSQCQMAVKSDITVSCQSEDMARQEIKKFSVRTQAKSICCADVAVGSYDPERSLYKEARKRSEEAIFSHKNAFTPPDEFDTREEDGRTTSSVDETYNVKAADVYSSQICTSDERKRKYCGDGEVINRVRNPRLNEETGVSACSKSVVRDISPRRGGCGTCGQNFGKWGTNEFPVKKLCRCGNGCGTVDNSTCCCRK